MLISYACLGEEAIENSAIKRNYKREMTVNHNYAPGTIRNVFPEQVDEKLTNKISPIPS